MHIKLILPFLLIVTLSSCIKEDEILTEGDKISKELQKIADEKDITVAHIRVTSSFSSANVYGAPFSFSGPFIIAEGHYYNLTYLRHFDITHSNEFFMYFY